MTIRQRINAMTNIGLEIYMQHDVRQFRCAFCHKSLFSQGHDPWFVFPNSHYSFDDNVIAYNCNKRGKFGTKKLKQ